MAKTQLNSPLHASKWGPKWVNSVEFGWEKWRGWCGKPFGIISKHKKKFDKISLFWPPYTRRRSHRPFLCGQFWVGNWAVYRASRHLRGSDCFQKHFSFKDLFQKYCYLHVITQCWHHIWRWNVFSRKTLFSERGMAKTQLNSPLHASKWGPKWVKSAEFGW